MNLRFGKYLLLRQDRQLRGPDGTVDLGDRSCDILGTLLAKPGQLITKQDLLDAVWPGVAVEENTLQVHVSALRKALGPSLVQTVHGRGYRYVGPDPVPEAAGAAHPPGVAPYPDRKTTSLAVLPFAASEVRDQQMLAEGLVEDLIVELARYRHLTVLGHGLSSRYQGAESDRAQAAKDLGVDFVITGSVRIGAGSIRVVVQLIDVETGAVAWGDRFSREMGDIFAIQDEIVGAVVGRLAYNLDAAAEQQRRRDPTSSNSAYVLLLQARSHWRNGEPLRALDCALKAIEIDPDYGRAHAYAGHFYAFARYGQWYGMTPEDMDARARHEVERALATDSTDPLILQRAALTYLMMGEPETALSLAETAAPYSPLDSDILIARGMALTFAGRKNEGADLLARAVALEPRLSPGSHSALAEVRHMLHDYHGSQAVLDLIPKPPLYVRVVRAANLARLGDVVAARSLVATIPAEYDCVLCARSEANMCALPEDAEHWLESFRMAGIAV